LGGLIGYVAVKDKDEGMAVALLIVGIVSSIIYLIFGWIFFFPHGSRA
jgi:hypothetical protein